MIAGEEFDQRGLAMSSRSALRVALLIGAAAALAAAAMAVQERHTLADQTVDDIEAQLASLDPATRAAVVAKLGRDAAEAVRAG
jgi:hypothetical protein